MLGALYAMAVILLAGHPSRPLEIQFIFNRCMNKREIDQLSEIARFYFDLASTIKYDIDPDLKKNIYELSNLYESTDTINNQNKSAIYFIAHLSSSAIRICTIYEIFKFENYRRMSLKNITEEDIINSIRDNLADHIPFLLRDNISHMENGDNPLWQIRQKIIENLTVEEIYLSMEQAMTKLKKHLMKNNCD